MAPFLSIKENLLRGRPMWNLMLASFAIGFATMGFEMSLARQAAPYVGNSMPVWACLISTILAASFIGYLLGAVIGKQSAAARWVRLALALAGGMILLIGLIAPWFLRAIQFPHQPENLWAVLSFMLLLLVSTVPVALLCSVSPILVRLGSDKQEDTSMAAGWLYASSTVGGLIGSLLPPFLLFPLLGLRLSFAVVSLPCLLAAMIQSRNNLKTRILPRISLILLLGLVSFASPQATPGVLVTQESSQNHLEVQQNDQGVTRLIVGPSWSVQSIYDPTGPSYGGSWPMFLAAHSLRGDCQTAPQRVLIVGLGGGTLARDLRFAFPQVVIDGIEPDREILTLAKHYFHLPDDVQIITQPVRSYLDTVQADYDLILIDAFAGIYVPFPLVTEEFFAIIRKALRPQGVLAINTLALAHEQGLKDSICQTLRVHFDQVASLGTRRSMNTLLYAWNGKADQRDAPHHDTCLPPQHPRQQAYLQYWHDRLAEVLPAEDAPILTDNHAPVEWLTHRLVLSSLGLGVE